MSVPAQRGPDTSQRQPPTGSAVAGWAGVVLATLISSFFAMFAGGEAAAEGLSSVGHWFQMVAVVAVGIYAVSRPAVGLIYVLLGGVFILVIPEGFFRVLLGFVLAITGGCFYYGRVESRMLAYRIMVGVPILVALVTGVLIGIVE